MTPSFVSVKTKIKRNSKIILKIVGNTLYVFDEKKMLLSTYNELGSFIWQSVNKPVSIEEIVKKVVQIYEVQPKQAEKDVIQFVQLELGKDRLFLVDNT